MQLRDTPVAPEDSRFIGASLSQLGVDRWKQSWRSSGPSKRLATYIFLIGWFSAQGYATLNSDWWEFALKNFHAKVARGKLWGLNIGWFFVGQRFYDQWSGLHCSRKFALHSASDESSRGYLIANQGDWDATIVLSVKWKMSMTASSLTAD